MTISEHLEFSVLTAPIASLDRRALSQAWYSALYGGERVTSHKDMCTPKAAPHRTGALREPMLQRSELLHEASASASARARIDSSGARGGEIERRAPRSRLARKIERVFLHPKGASRKAAFTLEGEHGRVQVILQSRGSQLKLIAICPPKAKSQVAHALAQARYALALRGISLDAQSREQAAC